MTLHPFAWCAWAIAALAAALLDRNPYLQALLLVVFLNAWLPYRGRHAGAYARVGIMLAVVPVLFSVLISRFGEHVLFRLPAVPVIGGPWTLEAVVFGATTGTALLLAVSVFGILHATVRSADLIGVLPRPLYRTGTVLALAVAFAPQAVATIQSIGEARRLRGGRTGLRAAPALLIPVLLTTLERALQYGESLDARGFGNRRRSRYRALPWTIADSAVVLAALAALILIAAWPARYDAYLQLAPALPATLSLAAVIVLAAPAVVAALTGDRRDADRA